jgi:hypothetical protein
MYMPPGVNIQRDAIAAALTKRYGGGNPLDAAMPEQFTLAPQAAGPGVGMTGWNPRAEPGGDWRGAGGTVGAMTAPTPATPPVGTTGWDDPTSQPGDWRGAGGTVGVTTAPQPGPIDQGTGGGGPVNLPSSVTAGMDFGAPPPPPPTALPQQPAGWTPPVFGNSAGSGMPPAGMGDWGGSAGVIGQSAVATPGVNAPGVVGGMNAQGLGQRA